MTARYREIAAELRGQITSGQYPTGTSLPRQTDLAARFGTTRAVIAEAIRVLEADGLVRAVRKRGTVVQWPVVRRRIERGTKVTRSTSATPQARGGYVFPAAHGERWKAHGTPRASTEPCPPRIAELLGVDTGSAVVRRRRVTSPEDEPPFQVADSWIHPDGVRDAPRAAEPDTGPGGYLDRLEEAGHGPISWTEHVRARMPSAEEADLLEIAVRSIVLELCRVGASAKTGRPIEVTCCVIPADRIELSTHLQRDATARFPRTD